MDFIEYHHYDALSSVLDDIQNRTRPVGLCTKFSVGKSVEGRELYGMRIASDEEDPWKPKVKYLGQIHGDETVGRELLIHFIDLLCSQYTRMPETSVSRRVKRLIDDVQVYVIPCLNPDGFERRQRRNANGFDLNRNFPDLRFPARATRPIQPETRSIMEFCGQHRFALSASFHGGGLVANYPFDGGKGAYRHVPQPTNEDALFRSLASTYARTHPYMHQSVQFPGGITNGAEWYVLYGGMQDWSYLNQSCPEVTLEVSGRGVKYPNVSQLIHYWDYNWNAMLTYLERIRYGRLQGSVIDKDTKRPLLSKVIITNQAHATISTWTDASTGIFHRLLQAGRYRIVCESNGYIPSDERTVIIMSSQEEIIIKNTELGSIT